MIVYQQCPMCGQHKDRARFVVGNPNCRDCRSSIPAPESPGPPEPHPIFAYRRTCERCGRSCLLAEFRTHRMDGTHDYPWCRNCRRGYMRNRIDRAKRGRLDP